VDNLAIYPDLKDRSVFITGGGSGIGAALTEGFLRQGAKVAFVQRRDGTAFADEMADETGNRPLFIACDITDTAALKAAVDQAAAAHGPVRVLVNNAANDQRQDTLTLTPEDFDWSMAVNLRSYFFAIQAVLPGMKAAGGGAVVNFSSISYMMPDSGYAPYITANAGITGLTRTLAAEFGPDRIRLNTLAPGWVFTPKQLELWAEPAAVEAHLKRQKLKDMMKPEDIVGGTLFLASDSSRMMTGQVMVIDGGVVVTG
jgi:galactose dehydrogenase